MTTSDSEHILLLRAAITVGNDRNHALEIIAAPDANEDEIKAQLKQAYDFDDLQAQSVLGLTLRSFTAKRQARLVRELTEVEGRQH